MPGHGWPFITLLFGSHAMPDPRYSVAMQAARQILDRLPFPPGSDRQKRLPEIACFVLGAINQIESGQTEHVACPRGSHILKSRFRCKR